MPTATPLTGSVTIHPNNQADTTPQITYTEQEQRYISFRRMRLISARDTRDVEREEWDDMPFLTYYDILKKADDQYVAPRRNAQDTSINLGTIRDKDTSLVEFAQSHDFEPVAQAYDESDDMIYELAETGEDLVRKSLSLEDWQAAKAKLVYRSLVAFGTALVEDVFIERWVFEKTLSNGFKAGMGSDHATWETKLVKQYDGCQAKLWDLRKCYFGDIRKFFMNGPQGQPYFFTVEYESYDVVKQLYGNWDRWQYVPRQVTMTPEISSAATYSAWWTLRPVSMNYVEIVRYYDPIANEFSITLNGVDMLPLMKHETKENGTPKTIISGFPLTEVSPSGAIPFAKYDLEPMHDFAYSKSQPGKMRVSAEVENMLVKLFIIMFKQKAKPTMGNQSGKQFGPEVTDPATIINDIRQDDLFPVLPNYTGAQPADYSFYETMKKELDKQSIERTWQGMDTPQPQDDTATSTMSDMKAQSLKVAALFDGIIYGNSQLYWLRTFNIMKNWTKPIDKRVDVLNKQIVSLYRTVTVPTESEGGEQVMKKIVFTKDTPKLKKGKKQASLEDSQKIHQMEADHKEEYGHDIRITHLHPELFATVKVNWYYSCIPVPNGNDPLAYMMFSKQITDAQTIFGPQSLNVKRLKHKFAKKTGQDFDTFFLNEQQLQQAQQDASLQSPPQQGASSQNPPQPQRPATPATASAPTAANFMQKNAPTFTPRLLAK